MNLPRRNLLTGAAAAAVALTASPATASPATASPATASPGGSRHPGSAHLTRETGSGMPKGRILIRNGHVI